jgi:hypothetical protein
MSRVISVAGPVELSSSGIFLPHEHIMSVFGRDRSRRVDYDEGRLVAAVDMLNKLAAARDMCNLKAKTDRQDRLAQLVSTADQGQVKSTTPWVKDVRLGMWRLTVQGGVDKLRIVAVRALEVAAPREDYGCDPTRKVRRKQPQ